MNQFSLAKIFLTITLILEHEHCNSEGRGTRYGGDGFSTATAGKLQWLTPTKFPTKQPSIVHQTGDQDPIIGIRLGYGPTPPSQQILETDDIDFTKFRGQCVEHLHERDPILHHYSPNHQTLPAINLSTGNTPGCVEIFDGPRCSGPSVQFLNVRMQTLLLKWNGFNANEKEKLQNFNIDPNSFSQCYPPEDTPSDKERINYLKERYCQAKFRIQTQSQQKTSIIGLWDNCSEIQKPQKAHYHPIGFDLYLIRDFEDKARGICIELYSKSQCQGKVMRFFIPPGDNIAYGNGPFRIWEFVTNRTGSSLIDTDVNSVRQCSFCNEKNNEKPDPVNKFSPVEESALAQKQPLCEFSYCQPVYEFLNYTNLRNNSIADKFLNDCVLFFNDSTCSQQPTIKEDVLNVTILEQIMGKHAPTFGNWRITYCKSLENEYQQMHVCTLPLENGTLLDHFNIEEFIHLLHGPGESSAVLILNSDLSDRIFIGVTGTLVVIMILIICIVSVVLCKKKRRLRLLQQRNSTSSRVGTHILLPMNCTGGAGTANSQIRPPLNVHQIDPVDENDYVSDITGLHALIRCFAADRFEIPRDSIKIGNIRDSTASIIGVGEFSIAFLGMLEPSGRTIAVKTMKSGQATARSMKGVLKECQVFMMLGKHQGIVEFLGVCTEEVKKGELFVVMEYCKNGPLKTFLLQQRNSFINLVDETEEIIPHSENMLEQYTTSLKVGTPLRFNTYQLIKWGVEVADAMEFLANKKIVHVSLSARNVLLDGSFSCKICDFHLAKIPGENLASSYNTRTITNQLQERIVPWRYFSIESLTDDIFSSQSDVWTFGIFFWEVFSLGSTPYADYQYGSEFTLCLKHGYRLLKPNFATLSCYELMLMCWYDAPEKRPSFSRVKEKLKEMIPTNDLI